MSLSYSLIWPARPAVHRNLRDAVLRPVERHGRCPDCHLRSCLLWAMRRRRVPTTPDKLSMKPGAEKPGADGWSAPGWCSASARPSHGRKPECRWRPGRQLCPFSGAALIAGNESSRGSVSDRADRVTLPSMVQRDQRNHFPPPVLTSLVPLGSQRVRCPGYPSVHNTYYLIRQ